MKITIPKQPNSSITEEITLELGDYTILAGENNSGKTNLIRAIKDHKDLKTYKKIFVPAEHIQPQNEETKNSAAKTEFYKLLKIILEPIFDKKLLKDLTDKFNNSEDKKDFVSSVNKIIEDFGVEKKKFDVEIAEDEFKEELIIKITKAFVKDLYKTDVDKVDFENIGMGTQRLIVAALIRYYQEKEIGKSEEVLIIFEEPEVYLHPKWKKGLYDSLLKLSGREKTKVLITTHDPYFIELGKNQKIYQVYRNPDKKDATAIRPTDNSVLLSFKSDSEINYSVYDLPTIEFHNELYGHIQELQQKYTIDQAETYFVSKGITKSKKWTAIVGGQTQKPEDVTLMTFVRHSIHHPENTSNGRYTPQELKSSIDELIKLIKTP